MESSVIKSYHEANYGMNVHSESYSSEGSSYTQTSPESDSRKYSPSNENGGKCTWNDDIKNLNLIDASKNALPDLNDSDENEDPGATSDYEEHQEEIYDEEQAEDNLNDDDDDIDVDSDDYDIVIDPDGEVDENGPVIHIFAVDPELDLECSSDEEHSSVVDNYVGDETDERESLKDNEDNVKAEGCIEDVEEEYLPDEVVKDQKNSLAQEYQPLLPEIGDPPTECDIDEECSSDTDILGVNSSNKTPESQKTHKEISASHNEVRLNNSAENVAEVDEFFVTNKSLKSEIPFNEPENTDNLPSLPTDLPQIDDFKKFFFEEMAATRNRSFSKSLSLPHSPSHLPEPVFDDGRTSLSFEDLNIHDLCNFDVDVNERANKDFDITTFDDDGDAIRTLNDEDINGFLIDTKKNAIFTIELEDDLSQQDMEIDCPVESRIDFGSVCKSLLIANSKPISEETTTTTTTKTTTTTTTTATATTTTATATTTFTTTDKPLGTVLDFCIEKSGNDISTQKSDSSDLKAEADDFVDVESFTENTIVPVLEANNLSSLLEQFEATENFKPKGKPVIINENTLNLNNDTASNKGLVNGTRIQDAAVQLNKHKMRHILMPSSGPNCAMAQKSIQESVISDHDYCSPSKRPSAVPNQPKRRQSLLKPEVLSSNNMIKNSRHRTCKSKRIVYNLSSDEEDNVTNTKKDISKDSILSNHRKKVSELNIQVSAKPKTLNDVVPNISSASNSVISEKNNQASSGSIKLTIRNKTKVILKIDSDENKSVVKQTPNQQLKHALKIETDKRLKPIIRRISENSLLKPINKMQEPVKHVKIIKQNMSAAKTNVYPPNINLKIPAVKKEVLVRENVPLPVYYRNRDPLGLLSLAKEEQVDEKSQIKVETEVKMEKAEAKQPPKKKLNLQEYRLRKEGGPSNNSSRTVSPEATSIANQDIFAAYTVPVDKLTPPQLSSEPLPSTASSTNTSALSSPKNELEVTRRVYDPIREASRKILMNTKRQKADAIRKRDEDIVMSKIPKVQNLELQPLISDADILHIVNMAAEASQKLAEANLELERAKIPDYEEIVMFSVGTNTDPIIFDKAYSIETDKNSSQEGKSGINFKIKKTDSVLKKNVFDKKHKSPDLRTCSPRRDSKSDTKASVFYDKPLSPKDRKIDKQRFKDITATLKRVEKNSDVKISSSSLFASIQDTVMKKAPEAEKCEKKDMKHSEERKRHMSESSKESMAQVHKKIKTVIVSECPKEENRENKTILHLQKDRVRPETQSILIQTEQDARVQDKDDAKLKRTNSENSDVTVDFKSRRRNDSDMSMSSTGSHSSQSQLSQTKVNPIHKRSISKERNSSCRGIKRSLSRQRTKRRVHSRSRSSSRCKSRSYDCHSRPRSHYRSYRRSRSPYRSMRSPRNRNGRPERRSPSYKTSDRRRTHKSRSRSKQSHNREDRKRSRSPVNKKIATPKKSTTPVKRTTRTPEPTEPKTPEISLVSKKYESPSMTPPLRKPTISESSDSSTSSSSSSSCSSSGSSSTSGSRYTPSPVRRRSRSPTPVRRRSRSPTPVRRRSRSPTSVRRRSRSHSGYGSVRSYSRTSSADRECSTPVEQRRIVFVGKLEEEITKNSLRVMFSRFGPIIEVSLHTKKDSTRYGFVTFRWPNDAWAAVESANSPAFQRYDVGFGGRRAFCRKGYEDLDGKEEEYTESGYLGQMPLQPVQTQDLSFDRLLQESLKKLGQNKSSKKEEAKV